MLESLHATVSLGWTILERKMLSKPIGNSASAYVYPARGMPQFSTVVPGCSCNYAIALLFHPYRAFCTTLVFSPSDFNINSSPTKYVTTAPIDGNLWSSENFLLRAHGHSCQGGADYRGGITPLAEPDVA